ncbi:hypothetical protein [Microvirga terricola]|uniref:Membrane-anchored ribosome-binding protein, inhibits growth in stationary phase, ElaB/YqjD/DUF883 family n=1 Tax=Microvirga terricola TaxID=2719797 RepID=A0ABX0VAC5_9HYPH|nr:hypothetical protein [Microvirga terricola]NIX76144.1 hypothetical protein [Microvirga terricola]
MADSKRESEASSSERQGNSEKGVRSRVSAGTSVGDIGHSPMPHAQEVTETKGRAQETAERVREVAEEARRRASETYEDATEWAHDTYDRVSDWASDAYRHRGEKMHHLRERSSKRFSEARSGIQHYAADNPLVVGLVGFAVGLLIGALLPRTRRENELFGGWSDAARSQGLRYAREAARTGREYVEDMLDAEDPRLREAGNELRRKRPRAPD